MAGTVRNHTVLDRYKEIVNRLYCEPKNEVIIGGFLEKNGDTEVVEAAGEGVANKKRKKTPKSKKPPRDLFLAQNEKQKVVVN